MSGTIFIVSCVGLLRHSNGQEIAVPRGGGVARRGDVRYQRFAIAPPPRVLLAFGSRLSNASIEIGHRFLVSLPAHRKVIARNGIIRDFSRCINGPNVPGR